MENTLFTRRSPAQPHKYIVNTIDNSNKENTSKDIVEITALLITGA